MLIYEVSADAVGVRQKYLTHLLELSTESRHSRFMMAASDVWLETWTSKLDHTSRLFVCEREHDASWAAVCHVVDAAEPEIAFSVVDSYHGQGLATRLLNRASVWAEYRGLGSAVMYCYRTNVAMRRVCEKAGATLEFDGSEAQAVLTFAKPTPRAFIFELAHRTQEQYNRTMKTLFTLPREAQIFLVSNYFNALRAQEQAECAVRQAFKGLGSDNDVMTVSLPLQNAMLSTIEHMVSPAVLDWAEYWAWECDWGTSASEVVIEGQTYSVTEFENLYDFLDAVVDDEAN
jgi:RimJ/RimL family protein N-acetyltransferase